MRDFVSYPTAGNERLHCTMKRTEDNPEVGGPCYTLYLEYLGGLVPILKGRRISKLRPEFVIMDPKTDGKAGRTPSGRERSAFCHWITLTDTHTQSLKVRKILASETLHIPYTLPFKSLGSPRFLTQ